VNRDGSVAKLFIGGDALLVRRRTSKGVTVSIKRRKVKSGE